MRKKIKVSQNDFCLCRWSFKKLCYQCTFFLEVMKFKIDRNCVFQNRLLSKFMVKDLVMNFASVSGSLLGDNVVPWSFVQEHKFHEHHTDPCAAEETHLTKTAFVCSIKQAFVLLVPILQAGFLGLEEDPVAFLSELLGCLCRFSSSFGWSLFALPCCLWKWVWCKRKGCCLLWMSARLVHVVAGDVSDTSDLWNIIFPEEVLISHPLPQLIVTSQ